MIKAGTIIALSGFALVYIVYQIAPLFIIFSPIIRDGEYKKMSIVDMLLVPLIGIMSIIPIAGILITYPFVPKKSKTLQIVAVISCYLIVIGTGLLIIGKCIS